MNSPLTCRFCGNLLGHTFADLGSTPLSNAYLSTAQLQEPEVFLPLCARACSQCFLVQVPEILSPESIFTDYAYFSSYSDTWLEHCRLYAHTVIERFRLGPASLVVEIASNDGYLLQFFQQQGVPVLGVEPAANVAQAAQARGIPTRVRFFGAQTATEMVAKGEQADLLVGNNVLAHVPDLNDFVAGMKAVLRPGGVITMEFPHLLRLMQGNQYDTIYHEHFSYFSFATARRVFARHGLAIFDVEELPTHGGSLRIYAAHAESAPVDTLAVAALLHQERLAGLDDMAAYCAFGEQVMRSKRELLRFLISARDEGKSVVGYGAPAKGNTLLNYCGIRTDLLGYTVDRSPHKQGKFLPGTHIPVHSPEMIDETRPDYVLILPWNLKDEIMAQMARVRAWGGRFVVPIPRLEVLL